MGNGESRRVIAMHRCDNGTIQVSENVMKILQGQKPHYVYIVPGLTHHKVDVELLLGKTIQDELNAKINIEIEQMKREIAAFIAQHLMDEFHREKKLISETEEMWKQTEKSWKKEKKLLRVQLEEEKRKQNKVEARLEIEQMKNEIAASIPRKLWHEFHHENKLISETEERWKQTDESWKKETDLLRFQLEEEKRKHNKVEARLEEKSAIMTHEHNHIPDEKPNYKYSQENDIQGDKAEDSLSSTLGGNLEKEKEKVPSHIPDQENDIEEETGMIGKTFSFIGGIWGKAKGPLWSILERNVEKEKKKLPTYYVETLEYAIDDIEKRVMPKYDKDENENENETSNVPKDDKEGEEDENEKSNMLKDVVLIAPYLLLKYTYYPAIDFVGYINEIVNPPNIDDKKDKSEKK